MALEVGLVSAQCARLVRDTGAVEDRQRLCLRPSDTLLDDLPERPSRRYDVGALPIPLSASALHCFAAASARPAERLALILVRATVVDLGAVRRLQAHLPSPQREEQVRECRSAMPGSGLVRRLDGLGFSGIRITLLLPWAGPFTRPSPALH